jgi:hypothetical protein
VQHAGTKEASHFGVSGDTVPVLCSFSSSGAGKRGGLLSGQVGGD